ncbi:hypothetical protein GALMADRAFT_32878, partial [Galerina marginata CBS 339.88]
MVNAFIQHILGVGSDSEGFYGDTDAYYGMVEQQGRLTLHLHMLLWIKGCLTPQEIRDKLKAGNKDFEKALIEYLETAHSGDFLSGSMDEVRQRVYGKNEENGTDTHAQQHDPTLYLTSMPPEICQVENCPGCSLCPQATEWMRSFKEEVDNIVLRSNVHSCRVSANSKSVDGNGQPINAPKGCITADGTCAARFPRDLYERTVVDPQDGHIDMKKSEPFINNFSPPLSALMRCNTDTTSLLSGTAVKAVISYVTDYVTKQALKTHQLFTTAYEVLQKQTDEPEDNTKPLNGARRTLLKIVNSLSTKLEIGSPMAAMYLLGHDDHYTSHKFVPFYWRSHVAQVRRETNDERVEIGQFDQKFFIKNNVHDYIHRPVRYEGINLYNWVQGSTKNSRSKSEIKSFKYLLNLFDQPERNDAIILGDMDQLDMPESLKDKGEQALKLIFQRFMREAYQRNHPQFLTHFPSFNRQRFHTIVPNFLGGGLPRSDEGDRDYYCSAMMTLFKPFRHGQDLKKTDENWDGVYNDHTFTDKEQMLMKNFNLRYECLDARDDHSAKRKAAHALAFMSNLHNSANHSLQELDERDSELIKEAVEHGLYDDLWISNEHDMLRRNQEHEMDRILHSAGYFKSNNQDTIANDNVKHNSPTINLSPTAWTNVVKIARDAVLKSFRVQSNSKDEMNQLNGLPGTHTKATVEMVRLLDAKYFLNDYQAKTPKAQSLINRAVRKHQLNNDQERAFRIIANHA